MKLMLFNKLWAQKIHSSRCEWDKLNYMSDIHTNLAYWSEKKSPNAINERDN